ncbi:hypothetical protein EDB80DRAFT_511926, partial [Ilyonectria destructans]
SSKEWVLAEGRRRTKIVAFRFLNLRSIAYNIPLKINESRNPIAEPSRARIALEGRQRGRLIIARKTDSYVDILLQTGYTSLFANDAESSQSAGGLPSFGNYFLIHWIIQQIFFTRQSSFGFRKDNGTSLHPDALVKFDSALRVWQRNWETTKDSSLDPLASGEPLSFNSTALFRLGYIRLNADLGLYRQLEMRYPISIARAFQDAPMLERTAYVGRAVLQSAHSLSISVRIGVEFVAKIQILTWSIVYSLCNLKCVFFLGKWLEMIAYILSAGEDLQEEEKHLMRIIASIVSEINLGLDIQNEIDDVRRAKRMAIAVIRLWAQTFEGAYVFDIMGIIGAGLDLCADII